MSRFKNIQNDEVSEGGIDISSLIDVVFIMLIFFIVTTTFVEDTGVDVEKTRVSTQEQLEKESIYIALTPDGEVVFASRNIGVTGVQPLVKRKLEKEPGLPVIIEADNVAESGKLIRIIEEAKRAGAVKVSVATLAN